MTDRIIQKHPDLGTREFSLVDDTIEYRISNQFGDEELVVVLSVLAPEPVVDGPMMYFLSEVNREALVKMFVDLPDANTFAKFISTMQQRIKEESFGTLDADNRQSVITGEQIDTTIRMLETYLDPDSLKSAPLAALLSSLQQLSDAPEDKTRLSQVVEAFDDLGMQQGPVLTYAPFFNTLLSSTDLNDLG